MARTVTTSISDEQYDLCRKNGWTWSVVMKAGVGALIKPDVNKEKIDELQKKVEALIKARENTKRFMGWSNREDVI